MKYLGAMFWLLTLVFAFTSMSFFQFTNFVTDFLMQRFKYDYLDARNLVALIPIIAIFLIPTLSGIIVVIGKKGILLMIAAALASVVYWRLEQLEAAPSTEITVCIVVVGFYYALYNATIWTCITLVVPQQGTNVALGLATTVQNVLMTILPIYFGAVNEDRSVQAYNQSLFSLRVLGIGGFISATVVTIVDFKTGQRLHLPENDKRVLDAKSRSTQRFRTETMITENLLSVKTKSSKAKTIGSQSKSGRKTEPI